MLENLMFSVNIVLPMCFFVLFGYVLKRKKFFSDSVFPEFDKFVFKIALPCMIFLNVLECDVSQLTDFGLIGFAVIGVTLSVILLILLVPLFEKKQSRRGAIVQGIYRSNFAVLGVPLAEGLAGEDGLIAMAVVMPFAILLFNAYAVISLSIFAPDNEKKSAGGVAKTVLKNIVTNPLIIGTAIALILVLLRETVNFATPAIITTVTGKLSDTVYALSLISLGASMTAESFGDGKLRTAVIASLCKTVVLPTVAVTTAALMGFRGARICVLFVLFGAPAAISSYIMAKSMKSDAELAGQILLVSTIMSMATIFIGVFILKTLSLI